MMSDLRPPSSGAAPSSVMSLVPSLRVDAIHPPIGGSTRPADAGALTAGGCALATRTFALTYDQATRGRRAPDGWQPGRSSAIPPGAEGACAGRPTAQDDMVEGRGCGIVQEQNPRQRRADAGQLLDHLHRLQGANHASHRAQYAAPGARGQGIVGDLVPDQAA